VSPLVAHCAPTAANFRACGVPLLRRPKHGVGQATPYSHAPSSAATEDKIRRPTGALLGDTGDRGRDQRYVALLAAPSDKILTAIQRPTRLAEAAGNRAIIVYR
jgi:hypothetical protein